MITNGDISTRWRRQPLHYGVLKSGTTTGNFIFGIETFEAIMIYKISFDGAKGALTILIAWQYFCMTNLDIIFLLTIDMVQLQGNTK